MKKNIKSNRYLLTFGAAPIDLHEQLESIEEGPSGKKFERKFKKILDKTYQNLLAVLNDSPAINRIIEPKKLKMLQFMPFGFEGKHRIFCFLDPMLIDCTLPERLQKIDLSWWSDLPPDKINSSPHFTLLYNGLCFAFYRPIKNIKGALCGAADARKLLHDLLSKKFKLAHVAPTPLRENFIVDISPDEDATDLSVSVLDDFHVLIKTRTGVKDPDKFMKFLFSQASYSLEEFYSLKNCHTDLREVGWELDDICMNIQEIRREIMFLSPFRPYKRRSYIKELELLIHGFYGLNARWCKIQNKIKTETPSFEKNLGEVLNSISYKLKDEIKVENLPISAYSNIAELGQKDIASFKSLRSLWIIVLTSISSAIIGAIIGGLLAQ